MSNIGNKQKFIEAFYKAVDQSSFVLKENPELTFPQLYNRLQWQAKEKVFLKRITLFETTGRKLNSFSKFNPRSYIRI